jgi:hypothetical protein
MEITLDTSRGMGFGDMLCLISLLCDIPEPVTLYSNNTEQYYDRIKQYIEILNIPEDKLKIVYTDKNGGFSGAWHLKTVSNYYYPETLKLNGKELKVKDPSRAKPYIGLAMYNGTDGWIDSNYNFVRLTVDGPVVEGNRSDYVPQCRWRSFDYYTKLFEFIRYQNYDVITLDSNKNLESKIEFLIENCTAVIGYEGGMAHLCHMLRIPFFMLDWRLPSHDAHYGQFQAEVTHQSRTVHMIRDDTEFVNMSQRQFRNLVEKLNHQNTNNRIVNGEINMRFKKGINSPIEFVNQQGLVVHTSPFGPQVSNQAVEVINNFYKNKFPNISL